MRTSGLGFLLVVVLSVLLDRAGTFGYRGDDWAGFDRKTFRVVHVADGDTLDLSGHGREARVRLLGIDAPELGHDDVPPDHWGRESKAALQERAAGRDLLVRLEGTRTRDKYGRLLAYLYAGESDLVNLALVHDGHAYADRRFDHPMRRQFEQAEAEARRKGRGLWKSVRDEQMPQWRQDWLARQRRADAEHPKSRD